MGKQINGTRCDGIRTLFLRPAPCYALSEASQVLGVSRATLIREARSDREEDYREGKRWRFTWRQAALIAFRRYPFSAIVEALGDDAVSAFPQLLILRTVTVRLPAYIIEALEAIASDQDETINDALRGELIDFAGTMVERMEAILPGYRAAYLYPGGQ